eukprot:419335-Rhodomonas_salina.1
MHILQYTHAHASVTHPSSVQTTYYCRSSLLYHSATYAKAVRQYRASRRGCVARYQTALGE